MEYTNPFEGEESLVKMEKKFTINLSILLLILFLGYQSLIFSVSSFTSEDREFSLNFDNQDESNISELGLKGLSFSEASSESWGVMESSTTSSNVLHAYGDSSFALEGALFKSWGMIGYTNIEGWVYQMGSNSLHTGLLARCSSDNDGSLAKDSFYRAYIYGTSNSGPYIGLARNMNENAIGLGSYPLPSWTRNTWYHLRLEVATLSNSSVQLKVWYSQTSEMELAIQYIDNSEDKLLEGYPGLLARCNIGSSYYSMFDDIKFATDINQTRNRDVITPFLTLNLSILFLTLAVMKKRLKQRKIEN